MFQRPRENQKVAKADKATAGQDRVDKEWQGKMLAQDRLEALEDFIQIL